MKACSRTLAMAYGEAVGAEHGECLPLGCFESGKVATRAAGDYQLADLGLSRRLVPGDGEHQKLSVERVLKFRGVYRDVKFKNCYTKASKIGGELAYFGTFGTLSSPSTIPKSNKIKPSRKALPFIVALAEQVGSSQLA